MAFYWYFPNPNNYSTAWLTDELTNYMKDSPSWEATSSSASQEIPCIL